MSAGLGTPLNDRELELEVWPRLKRAGIEVSLHTLISVVRAADAYRVDRAISKAPLLPVHAGAAEPTERDLQSLAHRLRWAMKRSGINKSELARRVGLPHQTIHHLADPSKRAKTSRSLIEIAVALDVSVDWLGTGRGDHRRPERDGH